MAIRRHCQVMSTRTEILKSMAVHRKGVRNEAERCVIVGAQEPFLGQPVGEMVTSNMKDVRAIGFCQGTRKTSGKAFQYRKVFRRAEVMECSVLKKLELTTKKMLCRRAVSDRARQSDKEQRAETR